MSRAKPAVVRPAKGPEVAFPTLSAALAYAAKEGVTGVVVDPNSAVIEVKNGKRRGMAGKWVKPA